MVSFKGASGGNVSYGLVRRHPQYSAIFKTRTTEVFPIVLVVSKPLIELDIRILIAGD
jgi:hypothetical protein